MPVVPTTQEMAAKTFLRPRQVNDLKNSIEQMEGLIKESQNLSAIYGLGANREMAEKCLQSDQKMLDNGTPQDYAGGVKNALFKRLDVLEEEIKHEMPTFEMMERPLPTNVDWHIAWERRNKEKILAWKAIRRVLDPMNDNPNFTNVEILRSHTPPKGDPRKYWQGFDTTRWKDDITEDMLETIDDEQYLRFLELRAVNWSKKSIMKQLTITEKQFELCHERFLRVMEKKPTVAQPQEDSPSKIARDESVVDPEMEMPADHGQFPGPEMHTRGLTLPQMSKIVDMPRGRVNAMIQGNTRPSSEEREQILQALDRYDAAQQMRQDDEAAKEQ